MERREFDIVGTGSRVNRTAILRPFDSLAEFGEYAERVCRENPVLPAESHMTGRWSTDWLGATQERTFEVSQNGDDSRVESATALLADIDAQIETRRYVHAAAPAGDYYIAAEVLAGLPAPMRRRARRPGPGLVRIYFDMVSSAGVQHETLSKRGDAALALASKLSSFRPVELYAVCGTQSYSPEYQSCVLSFKVSASPLNLAVSSASLSCVGLARGYAYRLFGAQYFGQGGGSPNLGFAWRRISDRPEYLAAAREALKLEPDDLYIPPPFLNDDIAKDPIAWIRTNVERLQGSPE